MPYVPLEWLRQYVQVRPGTDAAALAADYNFDADFTGSDGTGDGSSMFVALEIPEGEEWLAVVKFAEKVVEKLRAQA